MNGIELSRAYYEAFGAPMLEEFKELKPYLAVGFVGSGSDRFGFDDEYSQDHDYEPGFCIFLPKENVVDRRAEFLLERAYAKLPKEFEGIKRQRLAPVGGNRNGVIRTEDFYRKNIGADNGELSIEDWLRIPDYALAEATNGEVFFDNYGEFSAIRERLLHMPEDIRRKRIAGNVLLMAQSGQYNYSRCLLHGETEAAQLACTEFVMASLKTIFLIYRAYLPYYKWSFRALRNLDNTETLAKNLASVLHMDASDPKDAEAKYNIIEEISAEMIIHLQNQGLTSAICNDLEKHAYSVNDHIQDGNIRNMSIFAAV